MKLGVWDVVLNLLQKSSQQAIMLLLVIMKLVEIQMVILLLVMEKLVDFQKAKLQLMVMEILCLIIFLSTVEQMVSNERFTCALEGTKIN